MLNQFASELSNSIDSQDFLKNAFALWGKSGKPVSYGAFARRAGLSSRSFPRDVVMGKKRVTVRSLPGFVRALGLKGDLRIFFSLLVAQDEKNAARITKLRARLKNPATKDPSALESIFKSEHGPKIFAALGELEKGATLEEISKRSQLSTDIIQAHLVEMANHGLIRRDENQERVHRTAEHLTYFKQKNGSRVQTDYLRTLQKIQKKAAQEFATDEALYLQSVFSVRESSMPELKERLKALMLEFTDQADCPQGERVARVALGMILE